MSAIKPHSIADRIRLFFSSLEKWAIAMDDASPTNAIFERFRALEVRVARLENLHANQHINDANIQNDR